MRASVTLLAPRWPKMRFGAHLGLHLDGYWGASWRQDGAKVANLAQRCGQDGQLGGQDCQLGALFGESWRPLLDLGRDLAKNGENQKNVAKWLPKVRQVGHLSLQVGHLGHILAPSWPTWRHLGSNLAHLGAQMGSKRPPERCAFRCFSQVSRQTPQSLPNRPQHVAKVVRK